jgi:ubiquinone/menaquinone biosynthesis C-methylase UbiE
MTDPRPFQHPGFARLYMWLGGFMDRHGAQEHRDRLLAGLSGRVVDVGAGHGLTFPRYPSTVSEVLAVEPDDTLRAHASRAAESASVSVTVVAGQADDLPAQNGSMDAAVVSLVLCTVPDPAHALAEIARVLRPGGELRFYEHVRSPRAPVAMLQDLVTPVWSLVAGGCHPNRSTMAVIEASGLVIDEVERVPFGLTHVLGRAHRPG